jgi:thiamine-monophosphate kinase
MRLSEVGESELIKYLSGEFDTDNPRVIKGIGDDASVTLQDDSKCLLATTDILMEGVHFSTSYTAPYLIGKKAVSISLSDIAAMGGQPTFLLVSLSLPSSTSFEYLQSLYRGVSERADEFGVLLTGGNTSSSPEKIVIATVMLGEAPEDEVIYRRGAAVGDTIYVTGQLGDSALGLLLLQSGTIDTKGISLDSAVMKHQNPVPRVKAGRSMAAKHLATAMIDISDGLLCDLRHVTEASEVGAVIFLHQLPLSSQVKSRILKNPEDIRLPLSGGEGYELLFTASPSSASMIKTLAEELELPITPIGTILPEEKGLVVLDENGNIVSIKDEGFDHFKTTCFTN